MYTLKKQKGFTLVKAIVRKNKSRVIVDDSLLECCYDITVMKARGTLLRPKWYQGLLPSLNPEQEILECLVPNQHLDNVLAQVSMKGGLHRSGGGAIYSFPCEEALFLDNGMETGQQINLVQDDSDKLFKDDLVAIVCIVQKDKANLIAKEAMLAGAPGPTISYGFGRGIRDRLGIVRICISPEKELMSVIVNQYEANKLFEVMIKVGRLDVPGEGFIYMIPIQKGLMNIRSVVSDDQNGVTMPQLIKAIDELKGNIDWRSQMDVQDVSETDGHLQVQERVYLENLVRLTCVAVRGEGDILIKAALNAGAPGASVAYGRQMGEEKIMENTSIKLSNEREIIQLTLSPDKVQPILDVILKEASEREFKDVYFYTHIIPKAFTYLGPPK